ncbi:hypothetical protein MMC12_008728, partial [Toensbergia leucococca]|nr:hypothetical protein [Toensbergia leucococca]
SKTLRIEGLVVELFELLRPVPVRPLAASEESPATPFSSDNGQVHFLAQSPEALARKLQDWIRDRDGQKPPTSSALVPNKIRDTPAKRVTLTEGTGKAWVARFKINDAYMGWMIMQEDDSCFFVKGHSGVNGALSGVPCGRRYYAWLGGDLGFSKSVTAHTYGGSLKEIQNNDLKGHLSSYDIVKRPNLPRGSLAPGELSANPLPTTPPPSRTGRTSIRSPPPSSIKVSRSSSPEIVSARQISRRSSRNLKPRPFTAAERRASVAKTNNVPTIPSQPPRSAGSAYLDENVTFQFYPSDPSFDAVPKIPSQCQTPASFFDEALMAWGMLGGDDQHSRLAAVSVAVEGLKRRILVPWRSHEGYEGMMEALTEAVDRKKGKGRLDVEVKCIKRA